MDALLRHLRWLTTFAGGMSFGVPILLVGAARAAWKNGWSFLFRGFRARAVPATLLDARWGSHRWVAANGLRFHVLEKGDAAQPLLLALHGFPELAFTFRHVLEAFAHSHHVVAVDMRGYGGSDKPDATGGGSRAYALRHLVDDVSAIATAIGHTGGITLVGHDLGVRGAVGEPRAARSLRIAGRAAGRSCHGSSSSLPL